ncbi:hypothetical protein M9458_027164, partial [Cirrhinus mrigala]
HTPETGACTADPTTWRRLPAEIHPAPGCVGDLLTFRIRFKEELRLGETCKSNGVLEPHNDLLFTYALNHCQGEQQVFPDYVAYKYVLHYVPLSHRNSLHYHRVNVGVE